ncbi:hypothetical protein FRB91_008298 [Serendipita sp. 411]|nr:hypothetical protein FRB91_008298 [Serendipita sp. 411]
MIQFLNILFFFAAFILLLLVSISLPIAKNIKYFSLNAKFEAGVIASGVTGGVSFGNWGWCTTDLVVRVLGISHTEPGECSKPKLGFKIDDRLVDLLHLEGLQDAIDDGLTFALVLNPIACAIAFLAFLLAIWYASRKTRLSAFIGVGVSLLAAILTTIAFIIDITAMKIAKKNVEKISDNFSVVYGQTTWMTLVAMILLWFGVFLFCIVGFRGRRQRRKETY